jgi:hypothetical protein
MGGKRKVYIVNTKQDGLHVRDVCLLVLFVVYLTTLYLRVPNDGITSQ